MPDLALRDQPSSDSSAATRRHPRPVGPDAAAIGLPLLLGIAFLLRLPAVFCSRGYEFLDAQFQYVDPAWHLASGSDWLVTYEWVAGMRSWVFPWILSKVMTAAIALGFTGPAAEMIFIRGVLALLSLLAILGLHQGLTARLPARIANPVLLLAAANPILIFQGVHADGPALSCTMVVAALGLALRGGAWRSVAAGLALGLAFCCRPQDAMFAAPVVAASLVHRRWADAAMTTLALVAMVVVQGLVDLATWGSFLHSPIEYVSYNLRHSSGWGRESPWLYPLVLLALAPVAPVGIGWVARGARRVPWLAVAVFASLVAHEMLARKAIRFVTPALALFVVLWSIGALTADRSSGLRRWSWRLGLALHAIGWLLASFAYCNRHRIETTRFLSEQVPARTIYYCDLGPVDIGGRFYHRSGAPIDFFPLRELPARLAGTATDTVHVVTKDAVELAAPRGWSVDRVASFCAWSPRAKGFAVHRLARTR